MDKQYNARFSLSIQLQFMNFMRPEVLSYLKMLEKYQKKEINKILPLAIQTYIKSQSFDQEAAKYAQNVFEKCGPDFLAYFMNFQRDFNQLENKAKNFHSKLSESKENILKGKLHKCQLCSKAFDSAMGLNNHLIRIHKKATAAQRTDKKITKQTKNSKNQRRILKRQSQIFQEIEEDE